MLPTSNKINLYPSTWYGVATVFLVCFTIVAIVSLLLQSKLKIEAKDLKVSFVDGRLTTGGDVNDKNDSYKIGFWTPSLKTVEYWKSEKFIEDKDKWEQNITENQVVEFANILLVKKVLLGYRRSEVYGKGRSVSKPGYWWIATFKNDFTPKDFAKAYIDFWHSPDSIYVEIIRTQNVTYIDNL